MLHPSPNSHSFRNGSSATLRYSPTSCPRSPTSRPTRPSTYHSAPQANSATPSSSSYADAGTQYSPSGSPPTSTRSVVKVSSPQPPPALPQVPPASQTSSSSTSDEQDGAVSAEPPQPHLRVTPQSSLQNARVPARRSRSSVSESDAEPSSGESSGSPKRHRPQDGHAKVMPQDYAQCDNRDLSILIADMLLELIRLNDEIPLRDGQLTRFHSRSPPGISVRDYMARITFHATLPPPILLSMVYYIDKLCDLYPAFTINSLTVHRFLISAATVASKGLSDSFWTNPHYARVGGVSLKELALLELELLIRVHWRIVPTTEKLADYYKDLISRNPDYVIAGAEESDDVEMDTTPSQSDQQSFDNQEDTK